MGTAIEPPMAVENVVEVGALNNLGRLKRKRVRY
jgi:hypothetical protein